MTTMRITGGPWGTLRWISRGVRVAMFFPSHLKMERQPVGDA